MFGLWSFIVFAVGFFLGLMLGPWTEGLWIFTSLVGGFIIGVAVSLVIDN